MPTDPHTRPRLLIIWHSRTGAAEALARAAETGARREIGVQVRRIAAEQAGPQDLLAGHGYLFAAPENLAGLTGEMKAFLDRCYYPVLDGLAGRPYAQIIAAGSDGTGAARQLARIATGWRLRSVAEPLIVNTDAQTPEAILARKRVGSDELTRASELGLMLAAGLALGVF